MLTRNFTNDNILVSQLGFGCMRFPTKKVGDKDVINEEQAIEMIKYAYNNGVNYYDTAYFYHNGESETLLGKALKGIRDKVYIADKLPLYLIEEGKTMEEVLNGQLTKLKTDYVDFYMLHGIGKNDIDLIKEKEIFKQAEALKKSGKIRHFGFSFHDDYKTFKTLIDLYEKWEFCQIQYNYLDEYNQATTKGLKYAHSKGISVIIMEPLRGGALSNVPDEVKTVLDSAVYGKTATDWALSWLWDKREVSLILSGMSTLGQVKENIQIASIAEIDDFSDEMRETIVKAYETYDKRIKVGCTDCKYCMPCPHGVDIPFNFGIVNHDYKFGSKNNWQYYQLVNADKTANICIGCKVCEEKCPQKIEIAKELKQMAEEYKR